MRSFQLTLKYLTNKRFLPFSYSKACVFHALLLMIFPCLLDGAKVKGENSSAKSSIHRFNAASHTHLYVAAGSLKSLPPHVSYMH